MLHCEGYSYRAEQNVRNVPKIMSKLPKLPFNVQIPKEPTRSLATMGHTQSRLRFAAACGRTTGAAEVKVKVECICFLGVFGGVYRSIIRLFVERFLYAITTCGRLLPLPHAPEGTRGRVSLRRESGRKTGEAGLPSCDGSATRVRSALCCGAAPIGQGSDHSPRCGGWPSSPWLPPWSHPAWSARNARIEFNPIFIFIF